MGIDIEFITARLFKIKHKFLHPQELRFINAQPGHQHLNLLSILWSSKEAIYKWYGNGEVDFKEMMRTFPFVCNNEGLIDAAFINQDLQQKLTVHFRLIEDLTLAWVVSS